MSLHIGNLSSGTSRYGLERVFSRFGRCSVRIKDGYGFVVYDYPPNAEKALRSLRRKNICGEALTLAWSDKQPKQFNRFARGRGGGGGRSYEPPHSSRNFGRRGGYARGKLGSKDHDYRMSIKQSDDDGRRIGSADLHDKEVMYDEDGGKDNLGEVRNGYREEFLEGSGWFESDRVDNDRWGKQFCDPVNENGVENSVEFERYEPYRSYDRMSDGGINQMAYHGGSPALRTPRRDIVRDNTENLKRPRGAKLQVSCYRCGGSGHKMRDCPQESTSVRKSTRFDHRRHDGTNRGGSGGSELERYESRSLERTSRDSIPKRLIKHDMKSSGLGKDQRHISSGSSSESNETDKSLKKHYEGNKRRRKETESPKRYNTKKARSSFSSSLHSGYHSSSQSSEHVKRSCSHSRSRLMSSRTRSLSSKSRSSSTSHYSRSKVSKPRARSSSHTSLSGSLGQPLPSSSNKAQLNQKGSSDNARTPESKEVLIEQGLEGDLGLEEAKVENTMVVVKNANGVPPPKAETDIEKGKPLEKDGKYHQMASRSKNEVTSPSTLPIEKDTVDNGSFSPKSLDNGGLSPKSLDNGGLSPKSCVDVNCQNSDKLMTEHVPVEMKNPDSGPSINSGSGHSLSISSEELHMVLKHYYGIDLQDENERQLSAEAYFGSASLWPWEVIYYRRSKKGPISIENYARRLDQNREFGIADKYVRSSSGWGESTQ